jgi:hypothetical protein
MALFRSKAAATEEEKVVKPKVMQTENVAKELMIVAAAQQIDITKLDFNVLEMHTFSRNSKNTTQSSWKEYEEEHVNFPDKNVLTEKDFEIKQSYEIEVVAAQTDSIFDKLHCSVGANATVTKVYMTIREGSYLQYCENFEKLFEEFINKKKLRANIMVGIFDEVQKDVISKISARLQVNQSIAFSQDERYLIAEGVEPTLTVDDKLIMHFQQKHQAADNRIDYSKRDFVIGTKENELLIEYIKPKKGSAGRNCRGLYLGVLEPKVQYEPTFKVGGDIAVTEDEDHIEYRAKKGGYIIYENDTYEIKDELGVNEVSFKTTGSIVTDLDTAVTLNVKEADVFKDAIGSGMDVEVNEIEVEGNVGPKATVIANKAKIDGQTHGTSFIKADDLKINIHRGTAEGRDIAISRLERGKVYGKNVSIKQALNGEIVGERVIIDSVGSHVVVKATKYIEIKQMQGSENKFMIDPMALSKQQKNSGTDDKLEKLGFEIRETTQELKKYETIVKTNQSIYLEIKKRLVHYKKNNIKMPAAYVKQYKQFHQATEHLEELRQSLKQLNGKKERLNAEKSLAQEHIFDARIVNKDRWVGYNEIKFKLIDPPKEVFYAPPEDSQDLILGLDQNEEGEFKIRGMQE